jgi:hypothetical protein
MRRALFALVGFVFGLLFTWILNHAVNHMGGLVIREYYNCYNPFDCDRPWWNESATIGSIFEPSAIFFCINAAAWGRWSVKKYIFVGVLTMVLSSLIYLFQYVI